MNGAGGWAVAQPSPPKSANDLHDIFDTLNLIT